MTSKKPKTTQTASTAETVKGGDALADVIELVSPLPPKVREQVLLAALVYFEDPDDA